LGIDFREVSIVPDETANSAGRVDRSEPQLTGRDDVENETMFYMAGIAAKDRLLSRSRSDHRHSDWDKAVNTALHQYDDDYAMPDEEAEAYCDWLQIRVRHLVVEKWWEHIEGVAKELLRKENLSKTEVEQIVKKANGDQLGLIRDKLGGTTAKG